MAVLHFGTLWVQKGFPGGISGKEFVYNAGYVGLIPGSERYPGVEYGNSLQYSCLENPVNRRLWWARVHGVSESDKTERTHTHTYIHTKYIMR